MQTISVQELKKILDKGDNLDELVIDVRSNGEHKSSKIPGIKNIPLDEVLNHKEDLKRYKKVYIHCQSGNRSGQACRKLSDAGLDNLVNVSGGISEWKRAGLPIIESKGPISLMRQVQIAAGVLILSGVILSLTVNPGFIYLSGFVGAGLLFAGLTDTCMMARILNRMPWNA